MKLHHAYLVCGGLLIAGELAGGWAVLALPAGQSISPAVAAAFPPGHPPKVPTLTGIPFVGTMLFLLASIAWRDAERRWNLTDAVDAFGLGLIGFFTLLLVAQGAVVALAMDPGFNGLVWLPLAAGVATVTVWAVITRLSRRDRSDPSTPAR